MGDVIFLYLIRFVDKQARANYFCFWHILYDMERLAEKHYLSLKTNELSSKTIHLSLKTIHLSLKTNELSLKTTSPAGSLLAVKLHSENGVISKGKYEILISLILQWQDNPRQTMRYQLS